MKRKWVLLLAVGTLACFAASLQAQAPQGTRRPKLVVTDTLNQVTTLQPTAGLNDGTDDGSAAKGKDVYAFAGCGSSIVNQGAAPSCGVNSSTCNPCSGIGYVQFSTAGMPATNIAKAEIQLYVGVWHSTCGWPYPEDPVFGMRKVTGSWDEMALDWNVQPAFDAAAIASYTFTGVAGVTPITDYRWVSFDITDLYKGWAGGTVPNYGVRLSHDNPFCMNCDSAWFFSSDDGLTQLSYVGATSGASGAPATLSARLEEVGGGAISGRTVTLGVGGQTCQGTTDAAGIASCNVTPVGGGMQAISGSFSGDTQYQTSSTSGQFEIAGPLAVAPTIRKAFGAATMLLGETTSLSFTIGNPNASVPLTGVGFTDPLPAGLAVSTPNGLTGSCGGGTITAVAGSVSVGLTGATLGAATQCTFSVTVTGAALGEKMNTTGVVSSVEGGSGTTASASVAVVAAVPTLQQWAIPLLSLLIVIAGAGAAWRSQRLKISIR